jgi:hypothetical protein
MVGLISHTSPGPPSVRPAIMSHFPQQLRGFHGLPFGVGVALRRGRVMEAAGVSKDEAQSDICQAIADGAVKIRCQLKRHKTKHMTSKAILDGNAFQITKLKPDDLDWEGSHPVKPWTVQRGSYAIPGDWDLAWVKLSRTDVTNRLCPAAPRGEPAEPVSSCETGAKRRSGRSLKARSARSESCIPKACRSNLLYRTRICAGASVKSSSNKDSLTFQTRRS